jgi:hypothetical protein
VPKKLTPLVKVGFRNFSAQNHQKLEILVPTQHNTLVICWVGTRIFKFQWFLSCEIAKTKLQLGSLFLATVYLLVTSKNLYLLYLWSSSGYQILHLQSSSLKWKIVKVMIGAQEKNEAWNLECINSKYPSGILSEI